MLALLFHDRNSVTCHAREISGYARDDERAAVASVPAIGLATLCIALTISGSVRPARGCGIMIGTMRVACRSLVSAATESSGMNAELFPASQYPGYIEYEAGVYPGLLGHLPLTGYAVARRMLVAPVTELLKHGLAISGLLRSHREALERLRKRAHCPARSIQSGHR